jgi:hypothetical protein
MTSLEGNDLTSVVYRKERKLGRLMLIVLCLSFFGGLIAVVPPHTALGTTEPPSATPTGDGDARGEVTSELPPPDIPTSNQQGYTFNLKSALRADLDALPKEATVYELIKSNPTLEEAQTIADRLKIGAKAKDNGNGTFEATGTGQVFVSADLIQYFSLQDVVEGDLPGDSESIAFAREWLRLTGLLPPDIGDAQIVGRVPDSQRVVVQFLPEEPQQLLAGYPSITVTLGPTGTIIEVSLRWSEIRRGDLYLLRSAQDAWKEVESGQAYLEVELPDEEAPAGSEVTGTVTYSGVTLGYTTAGPPGAQQYLEPIYVFRGRVRPEGSDKTYPIKAYVAALANSGSPVGLMIPDRA